MSDAVQLLVDQRAQVGEGPIWHPVESVLYWVDVLSDALYRYDPRTGVNEPFSVGETIGAVAPRRGGLALATRSGFGVWAPGASFELIAAVEADMPRHRMNDGKCDPAGRFWAGTMADDNTPGAGSLYRFDPDGSVSVHLDGLTVSNGLDWSPDGRTMYFIDTPLHRIDRFEFDPAAGRISDRRTLVDIPEDLGIPDGLTVDAQGYVWVAMCFGSRVRRYSPSGAFDRELVMPTRVVTSCSFGGDTLSELFVTTGVATLSPEELSAQHGAGGLFLCRPGVTGQPSRLFAG